MRLPFYSLRTGILAELTFLIVAAMLLINVVMVKFAETNLIEAKSHAARLFIQVLEKHVGLFIARKGSLSGAASDTQFPMDLKRLIAEEDLHDVLIAASGGEPIFHYSGFPALQKEALTQALEAAHTRAWSVNLEGSKWGVFWFGPGEIRLSAPIFFEGHTVGGIHVRISLASVYRDLRQSQKFIFMYILLDTLVLVLVGGYLLSRIVVRPVKGLLKMTSEYKAGDLIPPLDMTSSDEIGELTRSLSHMLKRLEQNKIELNDHVQSLERANRELQQAQSEIIRSEKFASVGRLAAGVAHEIGNPIGIVLGYLELIADQDLTEEERRDFLDRMEEEIIRINDIIRQLLDFSRPSEGVRESVGVHDILLKTLDILTPQPMIKDIGIDLRLKASRDRVHADPNQLQQVFLNIIINAADALTEGGSGKEKTLEIASRDTDGNIELSFRDNGPGIAEEERTHIFDPFYTTKDPGKGTGLGLSVSYRIIENLGGALEAESPPEGGTLIKVRLPLEDH